MFASNFRESIAAGADLSSPTTSSYLPQSFGFIQTLSRESHRNRGRPAFSVQPQSIASASQFSTESQAVPLNLTKSISPLTSLVPAFSSCLVTRRPSGWIVTTTAVSLQLRQLPPEEDSSIGH